MINAALVITKRLNSEHRLIHNLSFPEHRSHLCRKGGLRKWQNKMELMKTLLNNVEGGHLIHICAISVLRFILTIVFFMPL